MRKPIIVFIQKHKLLLLLLLLLINFSLFNIPSFPGSTHQVTKLSEGNSIIPDMMEVYSLESIYQFLTDIEPEGRNAYQVLHLTTDLAFPLVYGLFFYTLISHLADTEKSSHKLLPYLSLTATFFDLAENFTLFLLTARYPKFLPGLTDLAQFFTIAKFFFFVVNILLIIFLFFIHHRRKSIQL